MISTIEHALDARVSRARQLLATVSRTHRRAALASSFGAEDMVLLDLIARDRLPIDVFTLDTGRLPRETLALIEHARRRYALAIDVHRPSAQAIAAYVDEFGADGFYESVAARKACCAVRKLGPLRSALAGREAWITGLRRVQAESRAEVEETGFDTVFRIAKFNPLAEWSDAEVWAYVHSRDVPYNALHDRGYPSIGCEPCTRAVTAGEHPRAGRWWWEHGGARKECGLHEIPIHVMEAR